MPNNLKIAINTYNEKESANVGDFIQQAGLMTVLPNVDYFITREDMSGLNTLPEGTKIILYGWYHSKRKHVNFPPRRDYLCVGFHGDFDVIPTNSRYAVGCRDNFTYQNCISQNIPAYISWCASMFLGIYDHENTTDEIILCDIPDDHMGGIPEYVRKNAKRVTHKLKAPVNGIEEANKFIGMYRTAKLVITSRLHAMIPCLAMGTPVVFIPPAIYAGDTEQRWTDYSPLAYNITDINFDTLWETELKPLTDKNRINGMTIALRKMVEHYLYKDMQ